MPSTQVIRPPVLKLMYLGATFAKSLAGLTRFAAMFTESVAITMPKTATTATMARVAADSMSGASRPAGATDEVICPSRNSGFQSWPMSAPRSTAADALVMTSAMAEKAIIVVGRPSVWPSICSR